MSELSKFWDLLTGGGGGGGSQPAYESAAEAEARRQRKVDAGLREIEKVFEQYVSKNTFRKIFDKCVFE